MKNRRWFPQLQRTLFRRKSTTQQQKPAIFSKDEPSRNVWKCHFLEPVNAEVSSEAGSSESTSS